MRLFCALSIIIAASCVRLQAQPALASGVAVVVNNTVITYADVRESIVPSVELLVRQYGQDQETLQQKIRALERERIEELVARQLILHEFTNSGYNLPESIIEDEIQSRIRKDYGDRLTLIKTLQAQGITYETYRKNIRENIIISAMREKHISQELIISPHKIETYYESHLGEFKLNDQVKLRMIVVNKSNADPDSARAFAEEVLAKLNDGAPFSEMATIYSEGSQRIEGGDWGWVDKSVLRKELADTAFSLKPGQHSSLIDTPEACYLMLVEAFREAHVRPLGDVRDDIEKVLVAQERDRLHMKWIDRLKNKSFVRYF